MTPSDFFAHWGVRGDSLGRAIDAKVGSQHRIAEDTLETHIRGAMFLQSPTGLAVPLVLLAVTLARYSQWEEEPVGHWLAGLADPKRGYDPNIDLVPPVLSVWLNRRYGAWWARPWSELALVVLTRFVVRQHQAMSDVKSSTGTRCLLQMDGERVFASGSHDEIGLGNPRLWSAFRILKDLGLMEDHDDVTSLSEEGRIFLAQELKGAGK